MLLCFNCVKADPLKKLIAENGRVVRKCKICRLQNIKAMNCRNKNLIQLFKALIRYHFSEWEYNTHWGGQGIEALFDRENPILNYPDNSDKDELSTAISILTYKSYGKYEEGITLFAGYNEDGQPYPPLRAIKGGLCSKLRDINTALLKQNYFLLEKTGHDLIRNDISILRSTVPSGREFYRARIGYDNEGIPMDGWGEERHYQPYENEDIGAPPPLISSQGRMNRNNVAFLYLSSDLDTAIVEVRPHPGQIVSTGKFTSRINLEIADFNSINILDFYLNDKLLDAFDMLKSIDIMFSLPVPPGHHHDYLLTQFLSDVIRKLGFDGIAYRSSVGAGYNIAIFDPGKFEYVDGSGSAVKAEKLTYTFKALPMISNPDEYFIIKNGKLIM